VSIKTTGTSSNVLDLGVNLPATGGYPVTLVGADSGTQGMTNSGDETVVFNSNVTSGLYYVLVKKYGVGGNFTITGTYTVVNTGPTIPTVQTLSASSVGATSATLNGVVVSDGGSSIQQRRFQWGASPIHAGWADVTVSGADFSYQLTGLSTGVTYYYRAVAVNFYGQGYASNDVSFVYSTTVPTIAALSPSVLTASTNQQQFRVIGSGFTNSSTLLFNYNGSNIPSTSDRLHYISSNEIDYDIIVTGTGPWTVKVVNGSQTSIEKGFTVNPQASGTGSLKVTIQPAAAVSAGQWSVDNGTYHHDSETVAGLAVGSHTVSFKDVAGYSTPGNQTVNILANQVSNASATYTVIPPSTYTLTLNYDGSQGYITNSPSGSGSGKTFTYTESAIVQLTAYSQFGYHFVGWGGDASGTSTTATVTMNGNRAVTAGFAPGDPNLGTVTVTILPPEAAAAGVKWGWNENDSRDSGSSYTTFPGGYFITLHPVDGWLPPFTDGIYKNLYPVTVTAGITKNVSISFTQDTTPGLLTVTLSPPDAVAAGAKWHVNGGAAQGSGATLSLPPGSNYSITFDAVSGWVAPSAQTVTVQRAQTAVVTGNYTPPVGQPVISHISPPFGNLAGGPLTIDGVNFVDPVTVLIGGKPGTNIAVVSATQITCTTPSSSIYGTVPVVVQTAGGQATSLNGFAYGIERGDKIELVTSIGGLVEGVAVQGNFAYVGEGSSLVVINISNPASPATVGRMAMPGMVWDIAISGQFAFVANDDAGLQVVDISVPAIPKLVGFYDTPGISYGITIVGSKAYVADGSSGLLILDITNPTAPTLVSATNVNGGALDVAVGVSGNGVFAYLCVDSTLKVVDVTNANSPTLKGSTAGFGNSTAKCVAVSGTRAFVAAGNLRMIDVSSPDSPVELAHDSSIDICSVAVVNSLVYTAGFSPGFSVSSYSGNTISSLGANNNIASRSSCS